MSRLHSVATSSPTPRKNKKIKCTEGEETTGTSTSRRRSLFTEHLVPPITTKRACRKWTTDEDKALVQYIALYHSTDSKSVWPTTHDMVFWSKCAEAISAVTKCEIREGTACRSRTLNHLGHKFKSIEDAENYFDINYDADFGFFVEDIINNPVGTSPKSPMGCFSPFGNKASAASPGQYMGTVLGSFNQLSKRQQSSLISHLFTMYISSRYSPALLPPYTPGDFISLAAEAINTLKQNNEENTLYHLASAVGRSREDGSGPRMPLHRMPWPLLSYNIKFFSVDNMQQCRCPEVYAKFLETLYCHFGKKCISLLCGPMWAYSSNGDQNLWQNDNEVDVEEEEELEEERIQGLQTSSDVLQSAMELSDIIEEVDANIEWEMMEKDNNANNLQLGSSDNQNHEEENVTSELNMMSVSSLFSTLSVAERREVESANTDPRIISQEYGVQPHNKNHNMKRNTMKAMTNVVGLSKRTLAYRLEKSGFCADTSIQEKTLLMIKKKIKDGRWWIKADLTDIRSGLRESMNHVWSGDVDTGNGSLETLYEQYKRKIAFIKSIGKGNQSVLNTFQQDVEVMIASLDEDNDFLNAGYDKAESDYKKKQRQLRVNEESLFALAWGVEGYKQLLDMRSSLIDKLQQFKDDDNPNIRLELPRVKEILLEYTKGLFMKKRDAASHILVFMVSDERRNFKPYAVPVRVLPTQTITDEKMRQLKEELRLKMESLGMTVVGFTTDGEFNSLRTRGSDSFPISIIELIKVAKAEASATHHQIIAQYLTPKSNGDQVEPLLSHPAIPRTDVEWLSKFVNDNNCNFKDAVGILKRRFFPHGYDPHPWIPGKLETVSDCLKAVFTIYLFRHKIEMLKVNGVDFSKHLYVPESHNGVAEHAREDHCHVLKRIASCVRAGTVPKIDVRKFVEALHDKNTGLTYTALTGKNKHSVADAERLLSPAVSRLFFSLGYEEEGRFVRLVSNWHKAADGRGISEDERSKFNKDMLNFILDDWMPWHHYNPDYSTIDPLRPIKGICGFTREIIVALIANIESAEWRRCEEGPPEHPRASTTDDVEGFFSLIHSMLGPVFDHKTFRDNYKKICNEFTKRVDPDLPYYYWTGSDSRFNMGPLPSFNQPSGDVERLDRVQIRRRADPAVFHANRASVPRRGSLTVRAQFFQNPEQLPPISLTL